MQAGLAQIARHSSSLLLFMVFCVVMGVGAFMIGDLHTATVQVQRMYAGSVQGLRQIGELQYEALAYPDKRLTLILMGSDRKSVHYIGAMDQAWTPVHTVPLRSGGSTDSLLRGLRRF